MLFGEYNLLHASASVEPCCQRGPYGTLPDPATQSIASASYEAVVATAHKLWYNIAITLLVASMGRTCLFKLVSIFRAWKITSALVL